VLLPACRLNATRARLCEQHNPALSLTWPARGKPKGAIEARSAVKDSDRRAHLAAAIEHLGRATKNRLYRRMAATDASDVRLRPGFLGREPQERLLDAVRGILAQAPLYTARMPKSGKPLSVRMSNCGPLGWVSDEAGYRYQPTHPETGAAWPPIPQILLQAWEALAQYPYPPEACLINFYGPQARMGLHQDRDEQDFRAPVVSVSLGDTCLFRVGGTERSDPTRCLRLASGDAIVLGGGARLAFHGVDRIIPGSSTLLVEGGRINLTLRRVSRADSKTSSPEG
jgi:alkylated DNA repair protein (DNA oxidative demethylase)